MYCPNCNNSMVRISPILFRCANDGRVVKIENDTKTLKDPKNNNDSWRLSSSIRSGKNHKMTSKTSRKGSRLNQTFPLPKPIYTRDWK